MTKTVERYGDSEHVKVTFFDAEDLLIWLAENPDYRLKCEPTRGWEWYCVIEDNGNVCGSCCKGGEFHGFVNYFQDLTIGGDYNE